MFGGAISVPLVIRAPVGAGGGQAAQHSQSFENWFSAVPGLQVVMPSTPADVVGLLRTAIRSDDPVLFFEHKRGYEIKGDVPEGEYTIPFGVADVVREGRDVTVVAISIMRHKAMTVADGAGRGGHRVRGHRPAHHLPLRLRHGAGVAAQDAAPRGRPRGQPAQRHRRRDRLPGRRARLRSARRQRRASWPGWTCPCPTTVGWRRSSSPTRHASGTASSPCWTAERQEARNDSWQRCSRSPSWA